MQSCLSCLCASFFNLPKMKNKILPTCLQGNYRDSLVEFNNTSHGVGREGLTETITGNYLVGFVGPSKTKLSQMSCDGVVSVAPDVRMNDCTMKAGKADFSALVHLDTPVNKGCDRDRYEASGQYRVCGAEGVIDLLPKPWKGQEWTKKLKTVKKYSGKKGVISTWHSCTCDLLVFLVD